jgi:mannose-6-phosphate isomerase-like protein (cupin superfamily)
MGNISEKWDNTVFADLIRNLPEIDINLEGIRGWLLQGEKKQAVFLDIGKNSNVPSHSHCAQWGVVLAGEMVLTISGETKTYRSGDWYYIPEGAVHSALFPARVNAIDIFDAADRYRAK